MGVRGLFELEERMGVRKHTVKIGPGKRIGIDASLLLGRCEYEQSLRYVSRYLSQKDRDNAVMALRDDYAQIDFSQSLVDGKFISHNCFIEDMQNALRDAADIANAAGVTDAVKDNGMPIRFKMRAEVISQMVHTLAGMLERGILPILIWDPSIVNVESNRPPKLRRNSPSIMRKIDRMFVYEVLRLHGFPSAVGWTEGEKVCCAAAREKLIDVVMSNDSDAHIIRAPCIIPLQAPIRSGGTQYRGAVLGSEFVKAICDTFGTTRDILDISTDIAAFLGCDFIGPVCSDKSIYSIANLAPGESIADPTFAAQISALRNFLRITDDDIIKVRILIDNAIKDANDIHLTKALAGLGYNAPDLYTWIQKKIQLSHENRERYGSHPLTYDEAPSEQREQQRAERKEQGEQRRAEREEQGERRKNTSKKNRRK